MTWKVLHASSVASRRWSNSGGGFLAIFWEALRDSFGAVPLSGADALSLENFASSGDMLEVRELFLEPSGVAESLKSSLLSLMPFGLGRSSSLDPAAVPKARSPPSMATKKCAKRDDHA